MTLSEAEIEKQKKEEKEKIEKYNSQTSHRGRNKKCRCGHRSLGGFKGTFGYCAYHWAEKNGWL